RLRDESHRFAIGYHRQLRNRRMTTSVLDGIPGLGPTRRKRLVTELGGIRKVRQADRETLRELSWLPDVVADAVYARTHGLDSAKGAGR
ncbi:MAG: excinuclease ABC subunit C, partial [Acidimicrobiia bacterium]|nr:excinuclease ABC subunit C [Acidimicrobiia bacterium]